MPMSTSIMAHISTADFACPLTRVDHQDGNGVSAVNIRDITLFVQDGDAEAALEYFERVCGHFRTLLGKPDPRELVITVSGVTVLLGKV